MRQNLFGKTEVSLTQIKTCTYNSKWKQLKYSRAERKKRYIRRGIEGQTLITAYFPFLDDIETLIMKNSEMRETLSAYIDEEVQSKTITTKSTTNCGHFLKSLFEAADANYNRHEKGNRYSNTLKLFASYIFVLGGRNTYETLQKNLPNCLPSITTIERSMKTINEPIREGEFCFAELKTYVQERSLPMAVWISEDGTRITGRIQYDSRFNQVIGFVLPFDDNGLPIIGTFAATSSEEIREYLQNGRIANYVYVIMAQPLQEGISAFCL